MSRFTSILSKLRVPQALFRGKHEIQYPFMKPSILRTPWVCLHSSVTQGTLGQQLAKENLMEEQDMDPHPNGNSLKHPDYFGVKNYVTLQDLFDTRVHMGHKVGIRNEFMIPYIFGTRLGMDIIDLEQTLPHLHKALNFLAHTASRGGIIMFVSRHLQTIPLVESMAINCGEYAHCRGWIEGTFVNSTTIFGSLIRVPDVLVFMTTHDSVFQEHPAVVEAAKLNIPTIGICDTSSDPRLISYPIPGNDDTLPAIQLYCKLFERAILAGKAKQDSVE